MTEIASYPDLSDASARLDAAIAEQDMTMAKPIQEQVEQSAENQPTPQATEVKETPNPLPEGTPAAAEKNNQPAEPKVEETQGSNYAKNQARIEKTWKQINADKEAIAKERSAFESEKLALQQQRTQWEAKRAQESAKVKPEDFEQQAQAKIGQATQMNEQADAWDARAKQLEDAGDFKGSEKASFQAKQLRKDASKQEGLADMYKARADELRKNPDPTTEQVQKQQEAAKQHYTVEAAKKWPELAVQGSEFQKAVAGNLKAIQAQRPHLLDDPAIIYDVARLVAAETTAASVPKMEKELGELRAKVKELTALTTPGGGQTAVTQPHNAPASEHDEGADLRAQALAMS
jgi:hypothetical protein